MTPTPTPTPGSPGKAWLRALELTAPIARNRHRLLSTVIEERAAQLGDTPALLSDRECLTYRDLSWRINQYARWALEQRIAKGEVNEEIQSFLRAVNSYPARVAKEPQISFQQHLSSIFAARSDDMKGDDRRDRNSRRH